MFDNIESKFTAFFPTTEELISENKGNSTTNFSEKYEFNLKNRIINLVKAINMLNR